MAKQIFIVDDSATILMSLKVTLEVNGFDVVTAVDGEEAVEKLTNGLKPDLIITDINMPRVTGLELIKYIRDLPMFRATPILILTTESQASKREEAKRLGATGWLIKPVAGPDLLKVIKKVLPSA